MLDRLKVMGCYIEAHICGAKRHPNEMAGEIVAPAVIPTGQPSTAVPRRSIDKTRGAVTTDIVQRTYGSVVAAQHDDRLAKKIERKIMPRLRDVVDMAHDLPGRAQQ